MALGDFTPVALDVKPPAPVKPFDLGGTLKTVSEIQSNQAYVQNVQSEVATRANEVFRNQLASAANDIIQQPDGVEKAKRWDEYVDKFHDQGHINDSTWQYYKKNGPSDLVLHQALASGTHPTEFGTMSGQTAANEARGRAPYDYHSMEPNMPAGFPALLPGAPNTGIWGGPASRGASPGARGAAPPVGGGAGAQGAAPATPGAPTANEDGTDTSVSNKGNPYYQAAPVQKVGRTLPKGAGIVNQGVDPAAVQAREEGLKELQGISDTAQAATKTQGELGSLESELKSGKVDTNRLAELKMTVAGYMNGMGLKPNEIKSVLGIDLPWSEVLTKDTTRMGLTFARQTEGAREAVQAIRIALGANPSILNTTAGNLKIIQIMDQGAKYDIERSRAAQGYMNKQQDTTGTPHLVGFDNWFGQTNAPNRFISKAVPYQLPKLSTGRVNENDLKDGVTYEGIPGYSGSATYDAKQRHFNPIPQ